MKNTLFSDNPLFIGGEDFFRSGNYNQALIQFQEFVQQFPNSRRIVLGRIAMTLLKLDRFKEAEEKFKEALELNPEKESEYFIILTECYYALGDYQQVIRHANNYIKRHGNSTDIEIILNMVLPHSDYELLLGKNDLNYTDNECAMAYHRIAMHHLRENDLDSAEYYSIQRLKFKDIDVSDSFFVLGNIYEEKKEYYKCAHLLNQLNSIVASDFEKGVISEHLLNIYKNSACFALSDYSEINEKLIGLSAVYQRTRKAIKTERLRQVFNSYHPVLDLMKFFNAEPQLITL